MKTNSKNRPAINPVLAKIAREILSLETLETRNSDADDFHNVAVWEIRDALQAAFEAGRGSVKSADPAKSTAMAALNIRRERSAR